LIQFCKCVPDVKRDLRHEDRDWKFESAVRDSQLGEEPGVGDWYLGRKFRRLEVVKGHEKWKAVGLCSRVMKPLYMVIMSWAV
jgi:hypothetical protein